MERVLNCAALVGLTLLICFVAEQTSSFIHEIGHLLGGYLAGYRQGFLKLGWFEITFGEKKQRVTLGESYDWQCVMAPAGNGGKAGLLAHILGGVILQTVLGSVCAIPMFSRLAVMIRTDGAGAGAFSMKSPDWGVIAAAYFGILGLRMLGGAVINLFGSESCDGATAREVLMTRSGAECARRIFGISALVECGSRPTADFEPGFFTVSEPDSLLACELAEIGGRLGVI